MAVIYIDNEPHEVPEGGNLLQTCLSLGFNIPYFCWHPALNSVGACRQCAVKQFKDENDTHGRIVMSCMTPVTDGMRISIHDSEVREFRARVIEWLMEGHPHDCPVCDEGGECHLQDMTVMTGHNYRRYGYSKRTYRNQDLGPFIHHEMNRCIQCYRCVRFYRDYAGGRDLDVFGIGHLLYYGRSKDGTLESEFSGNLVEICPTGVFTDKTLQHHYTRKWDLQTAPSVCVHCSLGCNTIAGSRYDTIRRVRNRYNHEINGYFLCDRGRYGYEFVLSDERIAEPLIREQSDTNGNTVHATPNECLKRIREAAESGTGMVGIASPRASLESAFALRTLVGSDRFSSGLQAHDHRLLMRVCEIMQSGIARSPSLNDVACADAVVVLGEDCNNTAPMLALAVRRAGMVQPRGCADDLDIPRWCDTAVREAVQHDRGPVFVLTPASTRLDDTVRRAVRLSPQDIARLAYAAADYLKSDGKTKPDPSDDLAEIAVEIAEALKSANRPIILSGTSLRSLPIVDAAAALASALREKHSSVELGFVVPECNSLGLGLMEPADLDSAIDRVISGGADIAIVVENDLFRRMPKDRIAEFRKACRLLVAIDHTVTETVRIADIVLPSAAFAETAGTMVNNEGRAQRFFSAYVPQPPIQAAWRWIRDIAAVSKGAEAPAWENPDDVNRDSAREFTVFRDIPTSLPTARDLMLGQHIPRQSHRFSGRTAMFADRTMHEPAPEVDLDSPLAYSMEGYQGRPKSDLIPRFWAPSWNSVQALNKFQSEVGGPLVGGDSGVRLIEPREEPWEMSAEPVSFDACDPPRFSIVPLYHVFGSEELSALGSAVSQRVPKPYLLMNTEDAGEAGLAEGTVVRSEPAGIVDGLRLKLHEALPRGVVGVPVGLPGMPWSDLPACAEIVPMNGGRENA